MRIDATHQHQNDAPRNLSTRLDLPVWDAPLPADVEQLSTQLGALHAIPSIRTSGTFSRAVLGEVLDGWADRIDGVAALRDAVVAVAPHRARGVDDAVRAGRSAVDALRAAHAEGATRAQFEDADRALVATEHAISDVRWGMVTDVHEAHFVRPADIARSRVQQFDADGDGAIATSERQLVRLEREQEFVPRTFEQHFNITVLAERADRDHDGRTEVAELAEHLTKWDGDGDGWLTKVEYERFGEREDAPMTWQQVVAD